MGHSSLEAAQSSSFCSFSIAVFHVAFADQRFLHLPASMSVQSGRSCGPSLSILCRLLCTAMVFLQSFCLK